MFYDRFVDLCNQKGIAPTRAAIEAGISKSLVSKWKANESKEPSPEVIRKLANYFGISKYEVLEDDNSKIPDNISIKEQKKQPAAKSGELVTEADKELFNMLKVLSDEDRELVKLFSEAPHETQLGIMAMLKAVHTERAKKESPAKNRQGNDK